MEERRVTFNSIGQELVGMVASSKTQKGPYVVMFHGLTNSMSDGPLIKEISDALVAKGINTFRFDFYGSGQSPGKLADKTWVTLEQNARDAIKYVRNLGATRIGLWGRSVGGALAVICSDELTVCAFVLMTAGIMIKNTFGKFETLKKMETDLEKTGKRLPGTGAYKGEFALGEGFYKTGESAEKKALKNLENMKNVLVLATTPDIKVSLENATIIINTVKDPKELHIFEGVDHDYKGVEGEAMNYTIKWFERFLL